MNIIQESRGFRNNNPGNIRAGEGWKGLSKKQSDKSFCQFETVEYGIRAIFKILNTYSKVYKLKTIEDIVSRWAPEIENDTQSYIDSVSYRSKIIPHEIIEHKDFFKIVEAIIFHENGKNPLNIKFIKSCEGLV